MNKITKKNTQHKLNIVSDIQKLTNSYLEKVKKFNSLFSFIFSKRINSKRDKTA